MIVEATEFSSIAYKTLLGVDARLSVVQGQQDLDTYQLPILTDLKTKQPILFEYAKTRHKATIRYRSPLAGASYIMGTALGYDIMTSHIASLDRTVDVSPLHLVLHDPQCMMGWMMVLMDRRPASAEQFLTRNWFENTWANYRFTADGQIELRDATPDTREFAHQVNKAPALLDYLRHLDELFRNPQMIKQAMFTGILDQMMIYRHRLEDVDGPDQRYITAADGTKTIPLSPADKIYVQQVLKRFRKKS